jgi:hypothetical protein
VGSDTYTSPGDHTPVPLHVLSLAANQANKKGSIISIKEPRQSIDTAVTAPRADTQQTAGKVLWHFTMAGVEAAPVCPGPDQQADNPATARNPA